MANTRFRNGTVDLELAGSEAFVLRQLTDLAPYLGAVHPDAFAGFVAQPTAPSSDVRPDHPEEPVETESAWRPEPGDANGFPARPPMEAPASAAPDGEGAPNDLARFVQSVGRRERDHQVDAALVFAYYLREHRGRQAFGLRDLLACCIEAGVDSRNFHRAVGVLERRGLLTKAGRPGFYRLSPAGATAVEERIP